MRFYKTRNTYEASNVKYYVESETATSYDWWIFVKRIEGKLIFNNYRYSISTSKHQRKIRSLLNNLGIKIDFIANVSQGLQRIDNLVDLYRETEDCLINEFLRNEEKQIAKNERAVKRRAAKKVKLNDTVNIMYPPVSFEWGIKPETDDLESFHNG